MKFSGIVFLKPDIVFPSPDQSTHRRLTRSLMDYLGMHGAEMHGAEVPS